MRRLVSPRDFQPARTFSSWNTRNFPSGVLLPPAVGTITNLAFGPPASSMNFSMMPVSLVGPPPTMTNVPFAGPYSGFLPDGAPPQTPVPRTSSSANVIESFLIFIGFTLCRASTAPLFIQILRRQEGKVTYPPGVHER